MCVVRTSLLMIGYMCSLFRSHWSHRKELFLLLEFFCATVHIVTKFGHEVITSAVWSCNVRV